MPLRGTLNLNLCLETSWVVYFRATWHTFQPKLEKIFKKIRPEKSSLYFRKWNLLALILKKFRKRKPRKKFLIFQEREKVKKLLIFRETKPLSPPRENFLYFRTQKHRKKYLYFKKQKPPKNPYTSGNVTFLYLRKQNFLIFLERYIQNPGITKTQETFSNINDGMFSKNSYLAHFSASAPKTFP